MDTEKNIDNLLKVLTKISSVFNDAYILKNGYAISLNHELPFLIQFTESQISLFEEVFGDYKIIHFNDIRKYKKFRCTEDEGLYWNIVTLQSEISEVTDRYTKLMVELGECEKWLDFDITDEEKESLFKYNDFIKYKPKDSDAPAFILTKSFLPLVTEKNYMAVSYSSKVIEGELSLIIFNIEHSTFRILGFHHYIKVNIDKE